MPSSMHRLGFTARQAASRIVVSGAAFALIAACSSNDDTKSTGTSDASVDTGAAALSFDTSAAVSGAADTHCAGVPTQPVSQASCTVDASAPVADAGQGDDASAGDDGGGGDDSGGSDYGPTMVGSEGDDDDCKYHVKWAATKVGENEDVIFQIIATKKTDNSPVTGANTDLEVFLSDTHPAPNSNQTPTEVSPGTYQVGPVRFDAAGKWTVRVHLFEQCEDTLPDSPHGHAAFYVNVP